MPAAGSCADDFFMKALVTGCAGFIGSTLAERLLADGADVIGIDAFTDYYARAIKERNLAGALKHPRFDFIEATLQDVDLTARLHDCTHVFHLAAQAGVRKSWGRDFTIYSENNIEATQVLLEAATRAPALERLVAAPGSSAVCDEPAEHSPAEEEPPAAAPHRVCRRSAQ